MRVSLTAEIHPLGAGAPGLRPSLPLYLGVGLVAGAVIALQICIMRIFSVGSWAHFGSLVVSLAMLAFGLVSAIMCVGKSFFARRWEAVATVALIGFAPLLVAANLLAQQLPFNAIFLVSDPAQKWRLFANFVLYLLPFLAGALFLGTVFLKADRFFARVYFADLVGAGLGGLVFLGTLFLIPPADLVDRAAGAGDLGRPVLVRGRGPAQRAPRSHPGRSRGRVGRGASSAAAGARPAQAGCVRLQGRQLRPQISR